MKKDSHKKFDVLVLGAGIIGTSTAWHLQQRGKKTVLLDRDQPGLGASYGNAGLIERSSVVPYSFPRRLSAIVHYAGNRLPSMHYDWLYLPKIAPWLYQFWRQSSPENLRLATQAMLPLIEHSVGEHDMMIKAAGLQHLRREQGWIEIFRDSCAFAAAKAELADLEPYQLSYDVLDAQALKEREPALKASLAGAIHWLDPHTITAPGRLVQGYCQHFVAQGGTFIQGNALTLTRQERGLWQIQAQDGSHIEAEHAVIALGWESAALLQEIAKISVPLAVKRGYHMHYVQEEGQSLNHPLCDSAAGFVLAPMEQGLRLTTGIEFASPLAPANEVQLHRCESVVRQYYALSKRLDEKIWLGRRPCLPDMRPVIGAIPGISGLWGNFGHAHHGLTLGPVSARLLSEMMTGEKPLTAPAPFAVDRFMVSVRETLKG